jgi:hypothetical protein
MSLMIFWIGLSLAFGLGWLCRALLAPDESNLVLDVQRAEWLRSLRGLDAWPVRRIEDLAADLWESGAEVEAFIRDVYDARRRD